jgi:hypothetical protein
VHVSTFVRACVHFEQMRGRTGRALDPMKHSSAVTALVQFTLGNESRRPTRSNGRAFVTRMIPNERFCQEFFCLVAVAVGAVGAVDAAAADAPFTTTALPFGRRTISLDMP